MAAECAEAAQRSSLVRSVDECGWSWSVPVDLTGPRTVVDRATQDLLTADLSRARGSAATTPAAGCTWTHRRDITGLGAPQQAAATGTGLPGTKPRRGADSNRESR